MNTPTRTIAVSMFLALSHSATAMAAPVVWHSVPDSDLAIAAGPTPTFDVREAELEDAKEQVDDAKATLAEARANRRDARRELMTARAEQAAKRIALWDARTSGNTSEVVEAEGAYAEARATTKAALQHRVWHTEERRAAAKGKRVARAEVRLARADLELRQARWLARRDAWSAPVHDQPRYERQVERIEDRVTILESRHDVAEAAADRAEMTWSYLAKQ